MPTGKLCSRQPKTLRQATMRAEFSLIRALISTDMKRELWEVMKNIVWGGGVGGEGG